MDITTRMCAVFMFFSVAILAAGVREDQRGVLGLIVLAAEAEVFRHLILSVGVVAVGTGPAVECEDLLSDLGCLRSLLTTTILLLYPGRLLLFLFIVLIIEFLDPPLDAAKVKRLLALIAVPEGASLVDRVVTDQTLLRTLRQGLHQVGALLCQTPELIQEVRKVILYQGFILGGTLLFLFLWVFYKGYLLVPLWHIVLLVITKVVGGRA